MEHPRQEIAAGACGLVDDHDLRSLDRGHRRLQIGAVAHRPIADERTPQNIEVVISDLTAAVVPLVDDDGLTVGLREKVAGEVFVAERRCVWNVDVGDAPLRLVRHVAKIALHPIAIAQRRFVFDGNDFHNA